MRAGVGAHPVEPAGPGGVGPERAISHDCFENSSTVGISSRGSSASDTVIDEMKLSSASARAALVTPSSSVNVSRTLGSSGGTLPAMSSTNAVRLAGTAGVSKLVMPSR